MSWRDKTKHQETLTLESAEGKRLLTSLQNDLRNISNEAKKKKPSIKEAAEAGIVKLRSASTKHQDLRLALLSESAELLEPFFMACDSKVPKMVQISINAIQRFISHESLSPAAAFNLINCLWNLMENEIEELRLLQTMTLLISINDVVQNDSLSKGLALCFRLHFTKNQSVNNAASATIRQLVSFIFERVQTEDKHFSKNENHSINFEDLKIGSKDPPKSLNPAAADAFLLFQDLVQLVNADQPFWLQGLIEMTRTFGLELLESIFSLFSDIFFRHEEFSFLLKEKVCPLVIKLFSPNIKYKPHHTIIQSGQQQSNQLVDNLISSDKPFFPISTRLLRIVNVLVQNFYAMLITECEIFLSLLIKFLESDKPNWQRAIALEVIHKMCFQPNLLKAFCLFYDMKPNSSKIFRDIITALGVYCQSIFISPPITPSLLSSLINAASAAASVTGTSNSAPTTTPNANQVVNQNTVSNPQPAFLLRGTWVPVAYTFNPSQNKSFFMDQLDKLEAPTVPEGYGLTTALYCLIEVVNSISYLINNSLSLNNENSLAISAKEKQNRIKDLDQESTEINKAILNSSWPGLVASFSLLLDASTEETITDLILKAFESLAGYYGMFDIADARDSVTIAVSKATLPIGYNLSILTFKIPTISEPSTPNSLSNSTSTSTLANCSIASCHSRSSSLDLSNHSASAYMNLLSTNASILQRQQAPQTANTNFYLRGGTASESPDFRQQVVAVGTPLPSALLSSGQQGPVMLTAKNLQCMRSLLTIAHTYGFSLKTSWQIVLTTLQHLVWILGLKPTTSGSLKAAKPGTEAGASTNALITTAAMSDLPVLSAMLSRLFESSHYAPLADLLSRVFRCSQDLDDTALSYLIDALCKLSEEAMEMAYSNREPSLFAVAKLLETGLVNVNRYNIIWEKLSNHLLQICHHPQVKMREWGAEALTCLIKNGIFSSESQDNLMFLQPLREMSQVQHPDIRQKQLDCVLQILQSSGDSLTQGWSHILDIIGAINQNQSENLIRIAFQCLQLIISDFLSIVPAVSLSHIVDTIAKFGSRTQELNVSLTAVSSLWNTADYLFQNREIIEEALKKNSKEEESKDGLSDYDRLWMSLFTKLGELCIDFRPAVRKSASQTFFSTLSTHGEILDTKLWQSIIWQVLFPLLAKVRDISNSASDDKITDVPKSMGISGVGVNSSTGSILLHHSRNTAQKQWSETQVLTLSGISRIFSLKKDHLALKMADFEKSWMLLLDYLENYAKSKNPEVSIYALKCFQEISFPSSSNVNTTDGKAVTSSLASNEMWNNIWAASWKVWLNIGLDCWNTPSDSNCIKNVSDRQGQNVYIPTQTFLTTLIQLFPFLFEHIKPFFTLQDFAKLSMVFEKTLSVPVDVATQAYIMAAAVSSPKAVQSSSTPLQTPLTLLQEAILLVMETLQNAIIDSSQSDNCSENLEAILPCLMNQYLTFFIYACQPLLRQELSSTIDKFQASHEWLLTSLVPFGERCLRSAVLLYQKTATRPSVIKGDLLHSIIKTLKIPLSLKYNCPSQSTWKFALNSFVTVLQVGLPITRQKSSDFQTLWADLALTLETYLFPNHKPPANQSLEEQQNDEMLDVKVVELIRDDILPYTSHMPNEFVLQIVSILNKGSIHSATTGSFIDTESTRKLKEEFARCCFETLLQFSFLGPKGNPNLFIQATNLPSTDSSTCPSLLNDIGLVNKLVVTSLLQRFHEVLIKFIEDETLSGNCPLPRHRMAEISFVLQALATLTASIKKAPLDSVEPEVWEKLISLYPHLVDCTISSSYQVNRALRKVLHEYKDLLSPPIQASHQAQAKQYVILNGG